MKNRNIDWVHTFIWINRKGGISKITSEALNNISFNIFFILNDRLGKMQSDNIEVNTSVYWGEYSELIELVNILKPNDMIENL